MDKLLILDIVAAEMRSGVLVLDGKGRALYANPFFLTAYPVDGPVEGRSINSITRDKTLLKTIDEFYSSGGSASAEIEVHEAGRNFAARLVPLKEKKGIGLIIFLQDITEEKRVETIKKDFVANVSHELRTPLASIKGYSETLLDGAAEDENTLREFLRVIDRHATRMSRLIDDLLTLSKLESHEEAIESSPVDVRELILATAAGFEKQARDKSITIRSSIPESLPKALGDRYRLEQVVVNILDNAIKYTPSGGNVTLSASRQDGFIRIDVADTGIGIPKEDIPRIFERFYRVDKARSRELGGTGLGLAIVKHIIQGHGGRLNVESAPGKGSTFSFMLKYRDACA
ncbi:MAG: ATP-binding protein [Deltaproteobacteria bacterium]|nr:ATP-binding protein [Deltaproteobacteria bacterium]